MPDTTVHSLFQRFQARLALRWIDGESSPPRLLIKQPASENFDLIEHMNPVHPHPVQIIGESELAYLEQIPPDSRARLLSRVCVPNTTLLLIADACEAPEDLKDAARRAHIAVLGSDRNGRELIAELGYFLRKRLLRRVTMHGVFMEVLGVGVLLTGKSGVGKSELALELISRGSRLIADDAPEFVRDAPDQVSGVCPPTLRHFLEVRGLGVLNVVKMFGDNAVKQTKYLRLVVHLQPIDEFDIAATDRLSGSRDQIEVLGMSVNRVVLPVAPGRNLAVLVETAVRKETLMHSGYDAATEFADRQLHQMQQGEP
ncbi:MAG: HPr(Ser) kinase/phosphatase [Gammaproteobacteria bacterium]|nr:HPr(Ser) kinase/phosphatase [Gammaproteobacteria bacterium]MCP5135455.1 HPr(Ser) kinase/phosphatase [Gammaproteobacteria bacterium]